MDISEVWIYILIILVAVIHSVYKAKRQIRKNAESQVPQSETENSSESTESQDVWDTFLNSWETPQEEPKQSIPVINQKSLINSTYRQKPKLEKKKQIEYTQKSASFQLFETNDDIRKAIIASEILTRKF